MRRMLFAAVTIVAVVGVRAWGGEPTVAVVNVAVVSEQYHKTGDLETQFDALRDQLNTEHQALRDKAERTARSLREEFKPGTADFNARRKDLAMQKAEIEYFVEMSGLQVEGGLAKSLRTIYDDIQAVVEKLAEEKGVDVVLAVDRLPDEGPNSPNAIRQQIMLQKVLYWNPRLDMTAEVVSRLNARYKATGGKSSLGSVKKMDRESALARRESGRE